MMPAAKSANLNPPAIGRSASAAYSAGRFGGDEGRAGAEEWVDDNVAAIGEVEEGRISRCAPDSRDVLYGCPSPNPQRAPAAAIGLRRSFTENVNGIASQLGGLSGHALNQNLGGP